MEIKDDKDITQGFISSCIYSTTFGCKIGLGVVNFEKISSTEPFKSTIDEEDRDVQIVALPFSSRLEKMK